MLSWTLIIGAVLTNIAIAIIIWRKDRSDNLFDDNKNINSLFILSIISAMIVGITAITTLLSEDEALVEKKELKKKLDLTNNALTKAKDTIVKLQSFMNGSMEHVMNSQAASLDQNTRIMEEVRRMLISQQKTHSFITGDSNKPAISLTFDMDSISIYLNNNGDNEINDASISSPTVFFHKEYTKKWSVIPLNNIKIYHYSPVIAPHHRYLYATIFLNKKEKGKIYTIRTSVHWQVGHYFSTEKILVDDHYEGRYQVSASNKFITNTDRSVIKDYSLFLGHKINEYDDVLSNSNAIIPFSHKGEDYVIKKTPRSHFSTPFHITIIGKNGFYARTDFQALHHQEAIRFAKRLIDKLTSN